MRENWCEECIDYDCKERCYFLNEICRVCIRNPYISENPERIFITEYFIIQPPEDLFCPVKNFNKRSIGFIVRFGKILVLEGDVSQN